MLTITCKFCGKPFRIHSYDLKRGRAFCSHKCAMSYKKKPPEQRFLAKVNKNGPIVLYVGTPCWIWTGSKDAGGYGGLLFGNKTIKAHHVSYILYRGKIPDDLWVLHKCDNRDCVNPDHLFLGTRQDNVTDMMQKNRHKVPYGERHSQAKLTDKDIVEIRNLHKQGFDCRDMAKQKGVSFSTIYRIVGRKIWKHI